MKTCSINECPRPSKSRGMCNTHYERWRKNGDPGGGKIRTLSQNGICRVESCGDSHASRGFCTRHYNAWKRHGDPLYVRDPLRDAPKRFLAHVDRRDNDECWPFQSSLNGQGYAQFSYNSKTMPAHVYAYMAFVGEIPSGHQVDHVKANGCRRRDCVNWVSHLEVVTSAENNLRSDSPSAVNARKTHCIHGHEFTPDNTHVHHGKRICRACARAKTKRQYAARKILKVS